MSKKTRRGRDKRKQERRSVPTEAAAPRPAVGPASIAPPKRPDAKRASPVVIDYSYVFSDLRRIAILAGAILVVMVVLTFIIK